MASAPHQFPQAIGRVMGNEHDGRLTFQEALVAVADMKVSTLDRPIVVNRPKGTVDVRDLPLEDSASPKLHQWVDIIRNLDDIQDKDTLANLFITGRYTDLPVPFCLKETVHIPYTQSCYFLPQDDGKFTLVKVVVLEGDGKLTADKIQRTIH
eukprot:1480876-Karenia_brevis.AAC.1